MVWAGTVHMGWSSSLAPGRPQRGQAEQLQALFSVITNHNSQLSIMKTLILLQGKTQIA